MTVVGIDGCRAGWLAVRWGADGVEAAAHARLADALALPSELVAIDMPIGLLDAPEPGGRACDREARRMLGKRGASVFSPLAREHLRAARFADARGISLQSWNLRARIAELDDALAPAEQGRVVESHPELAFAALAGAPLLAPKRKAQGRGARTMALRGIDDDPFAPLLRVGPPRGARWDDLLDACALAWTARRVADGRARRVPESPPVDARGLRMEIWVPASPQSGASPKP
ncbi:MAG TPA: DUF429 domain-containing protein [Candidatus Thermoplasmatota archaeon]|nr:DUF429 domain-containing protein [Candidatus Thermoplasmatota archaeon]